MKKPRVDKSEISSKEVTPAFAHPIFVGTPNIGDRERFHQYVDQIFDEQWLTNNGVLVQKLEQEIAEYHDVKHCVCMCSGTIALEIAIRALGLTGEVIVPAFTFIATAHALHWQSITPVFADINAKTHSIDPDAVRNMISEKTTGIIGVHLWGRAAQVDELQAIADEHSLALMFDAAHAFGCTYKGQKVGSFGECEVLSFHATKFFNTFEGGAVLTNQDELAESMRLMRNFGFSDVDTVTHPGTNGKMMEVAAAMGLVNLESVDDVIQANKRNYQLYLEELSRITGLSVLLYDESESSNYQYIVLEVGNESIVSREQIIDCLHAENIIARRYFWPGCHKMEPYRSLHPNTGDKLLNTELVAERVIVLPTGISMTPEKVLKVVRTISKLYI